MNIIEKIKLGVNLISKKKLVKLSEDENWLSKHMVTQASNVTLEKLVEGGYLGTRHWGYLVAEDPNIPARVLEKLSKCEVFYIKRGVSKKCKYSNKILEKINRV